MTQNDKNLTREIRVFLSSTFKDMDAERNYLLREVFPPLRQICAARDVVFTEIDLRWGVTEEESKNGRTVEICLDEIDRCRNHPPCFIGFLGERYGWIPVHEDLNAYWQEQEHQESRYREPIKQALDKGISVTELEIRYGVLEHHKMEPYSCFLLRDQSLTDKLYAEAGNPPRQTFYDDNEPAIKLKQLKQLLYEKERVELAHYDSLKTFGDSIQAYLSKVIDDLYPESEVNDSAAKIERSHQLFAQSRLRSYIPLSAERDQIRQYIERRWQDPSIAPLCLIGKSGLGKSAFIADLTQWLPQEISEANPWIFAHYVGAEGSRSLDSWRDRVLRKLQPYQPKQEDQPAEIPDEDKLRWESLPEWIYQAQIQLQRPMLFLIDALDQLDDPDREADKLQQLIWPPKTAVLVSRITSPGGLWQCQELKAPNKTERKQMINALEDRYSKNLAESQRERLLLAPQIAVPLYLLILFEGLRLYARFETLDDILDRMLKLDDAGALFESLLDYMDLDYANSTHPKPAHHAMALIAATRAGLFENELTTLLAVKNDPIDINTHKPRLPAQIWSPLHARLTPYLLRDAGKLRLMHDILTSTALGNTEVHTRMELVEYFQGQAPRAIVERCFQYLALNDQIALAKELANIDSLLCLYHEAANLLTQVLTRMGAGLANNDNAAVNLAQQWQKAISLCDTLPEGCDAVTVFFRDLAFYEIGRLWGQTLLDWRLSHPLDEPLEIATSYNNLAGFYLAQMKLDEAEPLYKKALDIQKEFLPSKDLTLATGYSNLAVVYLEQERLDEAQLLFETSIAINQKWLDADHPDIAINLNNLAGVYYKQKQWSEAERFFKEALTIFRKKLWTWHPAIAQSLNNLAALYQDQGRLDEAELLYKESLEITRKIRKESHPDIALSLNNLAMLYEAQGHPNLAEPLYKKALDIFRKVLHVRHPYIDNVLNNLAMLYHEQGRDDKAKKLLEEFNKNPSEKSMNYAPDYGLALMRSRISREVVQYFYDLPLDNLTVLGKGQYSTTVDWPLNDEFHALSLDFNQKQLDEILLKAEHNISVFLKNELLTDPESPREIDFVGEVIFGVTAKLGELQQVKNESFVPLIAQEIM